MADEYSTDPPPEEVADSSSGPVSQGQGAGEPAPEPAKARGMGVAESESGPADAAEARPEGDRPEADAAGDHVPAIRPEGIDVPLIGHVPFWALVAAAVVAVCVFLGVFWMVVDSLTTPRPGRVADRRGATPESATDATMDIPPGEDLSELDYEELMERGDRFLHDGYCARAAWHYRAAEQRQEEGIGRVLMARHWLSRALAGAGDYDEALQLCDELRSLSRPGDELWKHSLITSLAALGRQRRWREFFRHLYLLRANTARYEDKNRLDRWLTYQRAMAHINLYLEAEGKAGRLYGFDPPDFGRAPCTVKALTEDDIVVVAGGYGDGSLDVQFQTGDLRLRSEGARLGDVLDALRRETDLQISGAASRHYPVSARLEAVTPEKALEMVLGSVGLEVVSREARMEVRELSPRPASIAEAVKAARWRLQEFLILYPESENVAEAYYALGHLHAARGQKRMALDQIEILCEQMPDSPWSIYGHYLAGREWYEMQKWARAEQELLAAAAGPPDHPLVPSAFLWAGQCAVELEKYQQAVTCFRRALAHEANEPLAPRLLYNIAFCLEKAGTSPVEVQERYLELRTRYPDTQYGRRADYRLSRLALETGRYRKAVERYEFFLQKWSMNAEESPRACRDLALAYLRCGYNLRAVLLGEVMAAVYGHGDSYWQTLPVLLEACRQGELGDLALAMIDGALAEATDPDRCAMLRRQRVEFLIDLERYEEARTALTQLAQASEGPAAPDLLLCRARLLLASKPADGVALLRGLALEADSEQVRNRALNLLGQHCEKTGDFVQAARFYSGKCPVQVPGDQS